MGAKARRPAQRLQLRFLAHARSGDKGDTANIGLIALKPEYYDVLRRAVTATRVARHFRGMIVGPVERFELPNLHALKTDAQGKVFSTALLRMEIDVPAGLDVG